MALLRFAPSPTGALHLGGLRTALFNHVMARKLGGKWILRIEDTDQSRLVPGSVDNIRAGLEWAGLNYDYGPGAGGPSGPYFQSERLDLYRKYSNKLLDSGHAYRCFCCPSRLTATREKLLKAGSNATYDRACLKLTDEEVTRRVRAGERFVVRLNHGNNNQISASNDIIFGRLRDAHASLPTDPILVKSDLFPTYHLASVVDDHEMGVTHVLRGEEWLPSLPLHLDLYGALGLNPPTFAHLPLLLNPDGSKMSKRHGDVRVSDFIGKGWEPEAVVNWLAIAGWGRQSTSAPSPDNSSSGSLKPKLDVVTMNELIDEFELTSLTQRRTILDPGKLAFLNRQHLMLKTSAPGDLEALTTRAEVFVKQAYPDSPYANSGYIKRVLLTLSDRLNTLNELPAAAPYFFKPPDLTSPEAIALKQTVSGDKYRLALENTLAELLALSDTDLCTESLKATLHHVQSRLGFRMKEIMNPLRHALTGVKAGPGVGDIVAVLGHRRTVKRLVHALQVDRLSAIEIRI